MKTAIFAAIFICSLYGFFRGTGLEAAMTGNTFEIYADSFSFTDVDALSGGDFSLTGTGGEVAATSTGSGTFTLRGGFQAAEQGILSFVISQSAISIGPISTVQVSNSGVTMNVSTDSETGYTVALTEDGNLRSGGNDIDDVTDGTVTAGQEEYGVRTSGTDGLLSSDTAISGSVAVASATGTVTDRQTTIVFSAAANGATVPATYSHVLTFTATVNP